MTNNNYMDAINEAKSLLKELLNDPDHGKLTFKGMHGLSDLIITGPSGLDGRINGAVVVIDGDEWMALSTRYPTRRQWQCFMGGLQATSEELYLLALKYADDLHYAHTGDCSGADF
jgi:hypothetical protein|nr:MAG TPA: hypothetical protein [Caudoviricetes sp.]